MPIKPSADPVTFVGRLRESMQHLPPLTIRHYGQRTIFVRRIWPHATMSFCVQTPKKKGLQTPYEGPYKVVDCTESVKILRHGKEVSVSIDRLKPAYIPKESLRTSQKK
ncbi:uncharacterized protein TNCV_3698101 [Trichonephila clavipes]|uniref:Uncharacterized protein n=1 Tax=Trichonephila clavipes TaxID=2585209 RepID=A0A8X6VJD3_TRICX|nr:uncharacterized protein TNCV_3698101 [Trichonephila clavipes]